MRDGEFRLHGRSIPISNLSLTVIIMRSIGSNLVVKGIERDVDVGPRVGWVAYPAVGITRRCQLAPS
jgi:hypothetical protein